MAPDSIVVRLSQARTLPYRLLDLKGKGVMTQNGDEQVFHYNFRFKRDSLVWGSIGLLGVEGVRFLVSNDSIWLIDRMNRKYHKKPVRFLAEHIGMPLSVGQLQQLMLGVVPDLFPAPVTCRTDTLPYKINYSLADRTIDFLVQNMPPRIVNVSAVRVQPKLSANAQPADYRSFSGLNIPLRFDMQVTDEQEHRALKLTHHKVEVDPAGLSFNFNIPSGYAPAE